LKVRLEDSKKPNGCLNNITLSPWGFKAFVPKQAFTTPSPFITKFEPGHDARLLSTVTTGETIPIGFQFSEEMNCESITNGISVSSTALNGQQAQFDISSVSCNSILEDQSVPWQGAYTGAYNYSIDLTNVFHGIHEVLVKNVTSEGKNRVTDVSIYLFYMQKKAPLTSK
jgi:alpha-1,3-glucan synthase